MKGLITSHRTKTPGSELSLREVRNERRSNPLIFRRLLRSYLPRNDRKTVIQGVFVQALTICSECGTKTEFQEISIDFERKGIHATISGILAMVCPNCGEKYVP